MPSDTGFRRICAHGSDLFSGTVRRSLVGTAQIATLAVLLFVLIIGLRLASFREPPTSDRGGFFRRSTRHALCVKKTPTGFWVGTEGFGAQELISRQILGAERKLKVTAIAQYKGTIWLGTPQGVYLAQPPNDAPLTEPNLLAGKEVRGILALEDRVLIGTSSGLKVWDGSLTEACGVRSNEKSDEEEEEEEVLALERIEVQAGQGVEHQIWVGTKKNAYRARIGHGALCFERIFTEKSIEISAFRAAAQRIWLLRKGTEPGQRGHVREIYWVPRQAQIDAPNALAGIAVDDAQRPLYFDQSTTGTIVDLLATDTEEMILTSKGLYPIVERPSRPPLAPAGEPGVARTEPSIQQDLQADFTPEGKRAGASKQASQLEVSLTPRLPLDEDFLPSRARWLGDRIWIGGGHSALHWSGREGERDERFAPELPGIPGEVDRELEVENIEEEAGQIFLLTRQGAFSYHPMLEAVPELSTISTPFGGVQWSGPMTVPGISYSGCGELGCASRETGSFKVQGAFSRADLDKAIAREGMLSKSDFELSPALHGFRNVFLRIDDSLGNSTETQRVVFFNPTFPDFWRIFTNVLVPIWGLVLLVAFGFAGQYRRAATFVVLAQTLGSLWLLKLAFMWRWPQRHLLGAYRRKMTTLQEATSLTLKELSIAQSHSDVLGLEQEKVATHFVEDEASRWQRGRPFHYVGDPDSLRMLRDRIAQHFFSSTYQPIAGLPRTLVMVQADLWASESDPRQERSVHASLSTHGGIKDVALVSSMLENGDFLLCLDATSLRQHGAEPTDPELNMQRSTEVFTRLFIDRFGTENCILLLSPPFLELGDRFVRVSIPSFETTSHQV